jgi:hypothetical protein
MQGGEAPSTTPSITNQMLGTLPLDASAKGPKQQWVLHSQSQTTDGQVKPTEEKRYISSLFMQCMSH